MADSAEPSCSEDADDTSWVPKVDMEFKTDEDAYKFYNDYAKALGFSVRKAWVNRRASGVIISRTYVCYKEGYQGNKKDEGEVKNPRKNERTGCLAHMIIKITDNGSYRVSEFHPMHNHELTPLVKSPKLKSCRAAKKRKIDVRGPESHMSTIEYLVRRAGGYRQVTFVSVEDAADKSWAPKLDMEFESDEKAYQFYTDYAKRIGFDVRKAWVTRKNPGVIMSRTYVCYKEGFYGNRKDRSQVEKKKLALSARTGCLARMIIKLANNGRYHVAEFEPMHNHEFVTAKTAHMLKSYRQNAKAKTKVSDTKVVRKASRDLEFEKDAANSPLQLSSPSMQITYSKKIGDSGAILQYMQERQADDLSFYYAVQLDESQRINNIFWTDGKAVVDYNYFGDAICFDMTYKSNNYGKPFAPFYGVNHHKQIVFFGAALIYDESEESFKWLFQTFKTAVYDKQPRVILTDWSDSICNAIASVWEDTAHRFCVWHIYHSAKSYLSQVFQGSRTFLHDFSACLYDFEDEKEFISSWEIILQKYDLKENAWLNKLFDDRERWALPYGRELFCADMKNTQRKDNLSQMFKEQMSEENEISQFLKQYERIVDEHRLAEMQADCNDTKSVLLIASSRMLRQAANVYTPSVFEIFQREFELSLDCMVYKSRDGENVGEYKVTDENTKEHLVKFDYSSGKIACSCKKFELVGIQCRHVLKTLDIINIKELPQQYLLKRWRKNAKVGPLKDYYGFASDVSTLSKAQRCRFLCSIFGLIAARAAETIEGYTFVEDQVNHLRDSVDQMLMTRPSEDRRT